MQLAAILRRIESRLKAVGLSAHAASVKAGKPSAIRNVQRAVKSGHRTGITTGTLAALAPVLETTEAWLLTGHDSGTPEEIAQAALGTLTDDEAARVLEWAFQELEGATPDSARVLATAVLRAYRMRSTPAGSELSDDQRRELIQTAIRLFRPRER